MALNTRPRTAAGPVTVAAPAIQTERKADFRTLSGELVAALCTPAELSPYRETPAF